MASLRLYPTIFRFLFKPTLYTEITTLHSHLHHDRPLSAQLNYTLLTTITLEFITRLLTVTACLLLNWTTYFHYDLVYRITFKETNLNDLWLALFLTGPPLLALYLFKIIYTRTDATIWEPLYDLVVCHCNQSYFKANWQRRVNPIVTIQIPANASLSEPLRRQALTLFFTFEGIFYLFKLIFFPIALLTVHYYTLNRPLYEAFLIFADISSYLYMAYQLCISMFLVMVNLALQLFIYTMQYITLNRSLRRLVVVSQSKMSTLSILNRAIAQFQSDHSHLTTSLLHYNETFSAPLVIHLELYLLPLHAYSLVTMYFQPDRVAGLQAAAQAFLICIFLIMSVCATCIWLTNQFINRSAGDLRRLLVRCGGGSATNNLVHLSGHIKLHSYYQLLWRVDRRLGLTNGKGGAVIDSRFIGNIWLRYLAYVIYFGGNFIVKKEEL